MEANCDTLTFRVLGHVRCAAKMVADVPSEGLPGTLVLAPDLAPALEGLHPGAYIYVIVEFDKADPRVLTASPGTPYQLGAFALRGSDRPNRIGMTLTRIVRIQGTEIDVSWIDFSDGSPILDIKKYNPRWEVAFCAPRDDRRHIERQIAYEALAIVLARPMECFAGTGVPEIKPLAQAAARLVQEHNVFLGDPGLRAHVEGAPKLVDCVQGLLGASLGNGRLSVDLDPNRVVGGIVTLRRNGQVWSVEVSEAGYTLTRA